MTALVDNVTGADVAEFLQRSADTAFVSGPGQVAAVIAREAASAYTRGAGFADDDKVPASLRHVVLFRAARIATNSNQLISEGRDGVSMTYGAAAAQGFTAHEQRMLDEFRRRTCSI